MSSKAITLWVLRVIIILVCLFLMCKYELESSIVRKTQTFPYKITEVYCSRGKESSYIKISDKGKTYEVYVSKYSHCSSFKEGESVQLYYNHLLDYYFFNKENKPFGIVICMVLFGASFLWEIIDRRKNKEKYE